MIWGCATCPACNGNGVIFLFETVVDDCGNAYTMPVLEQPAECAQCAGRGWLCLEGPEPVPSGC